MTGTNGRMTLDGLTAIFQAVGARDPEGWAKSQLEEGIPQLGRYLFLRQAWRCVVELEDRIWISELQELGPNDPGSEGAEALRRMLSQGVSEQDITTLVRVKQWHLLFDICYLLSDPGELEAIVADMEWGLFQTDENGAPVTPLEALHESVLETEPDGNEMRAS